jgi:hypothetical protein
MIGSPIFSVSRMLQEFRHGICGFDFDFFSVGHGEHNAVRIWTARGGAVLARKEQANQSVSDNSSISCRW